MDKILQALYDGELYPAEQYRPLMAEYKKKRKEQYHHYEDFIQDLEKYEASLSRRFVEIMDEQIDTLPFELSEMFIDGFRLGARMMIEIFEDKYKKNIEE